ncbi:DUF726 domain-containing protein [Pseudooceanicola sp. C21-150M6]|uniref:DUF726 domain-containing protein n=1 Tax=Pseudooceanicola sp. C21-150M6 TaxID=3434355 RepID=UPI003D7F3CCD
MVRINLEDSGLALHGSGAPVGPELARHMSATGPVVIMIHGFKFAPGDPRHCPHRHIFALHDEHACWKAKSWPRELTRQDADDVLTVAFGWPARGSIWQAYDRAAQAGRALAQMITEIRRLMPHRPVHALAHSLGARVVLSALPHLAPGDLSRAVLLAGAELSDRAQTALMTHAGRQTEVISVTSRENRLYDHLLEQAFGRANGPAIGRQAPDLPNWLTLPLDCMETLEGLRTLGFDIPPAERWVCHWSAYLRPGVFDLYSALLVRQAPMPLEQLRQSIATPAPAARGWLRIPQFSLPEMTLRRASF